MATTTYFGNLNFIGNGTPKELLYQDDRCLVYEECENRQAPVHFVVVPKTSIPRLSNASKEDEQLLGHLLLVGKQVAIEQGLGTSGYHLVVDEDYKNPRLKSLHIFGRALHHMLWPTGPGCRL